MSRRTARKHIFNVIFQSEFNKEVGIDEALNVYREEYEEYVEDDEKFIKCELDGIQKCIEEIDKTISEFATGWSLERLSKVDLAILRIAVYEIMFSEDVPNKVAANEAVELAKEFSEDKAPAFINGVLGKVVKSCEEK